MHFNAISACIHSAQNMTIEQVLQKHKSDVLYKDVYNMQRITVRRGSILEDTVFVLRQGFDGKKHIRVRFVGEPAVDEGGPRREFFMLLMNAIANNGSLLQGPPERRLLRHNTGAFQVITCDLHGCGFGDGTHNYYCFLSYNRKSSTFLWAR